MSAIWFVSGDLGRFSVAELSHMIAVTLAWYLAVLQLRAKRALSRGQAAGLVQAASLLGFARLPRAQVAIGIGFHGS